METPLKIQDRMTITLSCFGTPQIKNVLTAEAMIEVAEEGVFVSGVFVHVCGVGGGRHVDDGWNCWHSFTAVISPFPARSLPTVGSS